MSTVGNFGDTSTVGKFGDTLTVGNSATVNRRQLGDTSTVGKRQILNCKQQRG